MDNSKGTTYSMADLLKVAHSAGVAVTEMSVTPVTIQGQTYGLMDMESYQQLNKILNYLVIAVFERLRNDATEAEWTDYLSRTPSAFIDPPST